MNYEQARELIQDGDIVFPRKGESIGAWITQWFTNSPYYHAAIAFWMHDDRHPARLFVVEEHMGGQRIVNLSSYSHHVIDIIAAPVVWDLYGEDLLNNTGSTGYAYGDLISIGLLEKFQLNWRDHNGEVCSEMVARRLRDNKVALSSNLLSPNSLYQELLKLGYNKRCVVEPASPDRSRSLFR